MNTQFPYILHICQALAWEQAQKRGDYRDQSLIEEGFIHCSAPEQVLAVANHYYRGERDLLLLWIQPERLAAELRWDPVGETTFPHVYGPINLEAVRHVTRFLPDEQGTFRSLPDPFVGVG
jgi:uncharacterized protein (DUF952 family)